VSAKIQLRAVTKRYGDVNVLSPLTLDIEEGSFTSLLGASGSGKTTLLNLVAGLDQPSSGEISIGSTLAYSQEKRVALPAERRNIGFVFQSFALWPHMRVLDIVAYPLRIRGIRKTERYDEARKLLGRLGLDHLSDRYPYALSGGQQQRVAIARALIHRPQLLLLDEPLSSLDVQLREKARAWIARVQREFGLTTILVTHDHVEALSLSDRVILLNHGKIEQDTHPRQIYERPLTAFAADFIGGANVFNGVVRDCVAAPDGLFRISMAIGDTTFDVLSNAPREKGSPISVAVRPQRLSLSRERAADQGGLSVPFKVETITYQGQDWQVVGTTPVGELRVITNRSPEGEGLMVSARIEHLLCLAD
jgi:iron(III) transport system ATP-binding protein